jgi:hypothetical protein
MKKLNKVLIVGVYAIVGIAATACGKAPQKYNSSAATTVQGLAGNSTPTSIQGQWTNCTNGTMTGYDFFGNEYGTWVNTDSNSDCSDDPGMTENTLQTGTFQLGSAPQAGYEQAITLNPIALGGAETETGFVLVIGTELNINISGQPSMSLNPVPIMSSN